MKNEEKTEIILWDWLIKNKQYIKEIYFNRVNQLDCKTFTTKGINEKPDFVICLDRGFGVEYMAVEIKPINSSRAIHDAGKILMYYENYITNKTKYFIDGNEIKINHFAVATENSPNGKLFAEDDFLITNTDSTDDWRKTNAKLKHIPEQEYQRTSDFQRRLWSEWRGLKRRIKQNKNLPSIGIIISNPNKDNNPYLFTMIWKDWLDKKWGQRFYRL